MIRSQFVVALAAAGFVGMIGCSAHVTPPAVAVTAPVPVVVADVPPPPPAPPPPRLATVCDAEIRPEGHLHFPHEVEFDVGKATIKPSPTTNAILQCLVDFLNNNKMVNKFRLEGYTDSDGDAQANIKLSDDRANAVVAWMEAHGIEHGRVWAKGYGPVRPVAPNDSAEHKAQNRRVEFHIDELDHVHVNKDRIALAMNPPMPVAAAPVQGVAVVGVGVPAVAVTTPGVAVAAPTMAVGVTAPTSVSVGIGGGSAPKKK